MVSTGHTENLSRASLVLQAQKQLPPGRQARILPKARERRGLMWTPILLSEIPKPLIRSGEVRVLNFWQSGKTSFERCDWFLFLSEPEENGFKTKSAQLRMGK